MGAASMIVIGSDSGVSILFNIRNIADVERVLGVEWLMGTSATKEDRVACALECVHGKAERMTRILLDKFCSKFDSGFSTELFDTVLILLKMTTWQPVQRSSDSVVSLHNLACVSRLSKTRRASIETCILRLSCAAWEAKQLPKLSNISERKWEELSRSGLLA